MVFYIVFSVFNRFGVENYGLFLITALFPWQWVSNSLGVAPNTFYGNGDIIKKTKFSRHLIVAAVVFQDCFHFLLSIPVIIVFLLVHDMLPSFHWLWQVPILALIQLSLVYGMALVLASLNLFFRDMEKLTSILLMFLFYFTPVLYALDNVPPEYQQWVMLNPMAPLMISWRSVFMEGVMPWEYLGYAIVYAAFFAALGRAVYSKLVWRFAEVL
jgi:lipopolysaccharide transport system permease protein